MAAVVVAVVVLDINLFGLTGDDVKFKIRLTK